MANNATKTILELLQINNPNKETKNETTNTKEKNEYKNKKRVRNQT